MLMTNEEFRTEVDLLRSCVHVMGRTCSMEELSHMNSISGLIIRNIYEYNVRRIMGLESSGSCGAKEGKETDPFPQF